MPDRPTVAVTVEQLGPTDPRFARWHSVISAAHAHGREPGWWESAEATIRYFAREPVHHRYLALAATVDGQVVGGAELGLPLEQDTATMTVELGVLPALRGRGIGEALAAEVARQARAAQRSVIQCEIPVPDAVADADWPGTRFAARHGLVLVSVEHRFLLDLDAGHVSDTDTDTDTNGPLRPGERVLSWVGPCPDQQLAQWAVMQTRLAADLPIGDLSVTPRTVDVDRVRESERVMAEQGWTKVRTMLLDEGGAGLGYTELLVSAHDPDVVVQEETYVDRAHRGRRLGLLLKIANLRLLRTHDDGTLLGRRRWVQTFCEQDNEPMRRTNARLGFRQVDRLAHVEGPVPAGGGR